MISNKREEFVWGALLGGAIGAAAALLFTPYSGAEIRRHVRKGFNRLNGQNIQKTAMAIRAKTLRTKAKKIAGARSTRKKIRPR
jgi:gas vesicle protein